MLATSIVVGLAKPYLFFIPAVIYALTLGWLWRCFRRGEVRFDPSGGVTDVGFLGSRQWDSSEVVAVGAASGVHETHSPGSAPSCGCAFAATRRRSGCADTCRAPWNRPGMIFTVSPRPVGKSRRVMCAGTGTSMPARSVS